MLSVPLLRALTSRCRAQVRWPEPTKAFVSGTKPAGNGSGGSIKIVPRHQAGGGPVVQSVEGGLCWRGHKPLDVLPRRKTSAIVVLMVSGLFLF